MLPIPMDQSLFQRISPYARLSKTYLESLQYKAPFHVQSTPELPDYIVKGLENKAAAVRDEYLSFVIQPLPATEHICAGASFTYHFKSRRMYAFIHGLQSSRIGLFPEWLEQGAARETFFLIPSIILQQNLRRGVESLNVWHDDIYRLESLLGIRHDASHTTSYPRTMDFTRLSRDLNMITTNLAFYTWDCKTNVRLLNFLDEIARRYRVLAVRNGHKETNAADIERVLLETHEHLRCWNAGLADRVEYLTKRGQALVQSVYSGIAQRDSAHSLELAATSTQLSKISYGVAIATSRDSALMRIIAAITVFFLPATFTATFFSTSFFDFNVARNEPVYSWWLWLYFLVTLILTIITMVGTWMLWKKESKTAVRKADL
ncbi:hypothetical protein K505DRAFT_89541 [Melanomma pulvis-pyrius CBS 109.77]|uniref:Uncharacterized protein n=1 Tax=Melanomma pulvis-pyrius CBS 109.77 TaxID=1314802 RepID=A0A6A6X0C1_9PLEO|nr:hypothetical protein K505DRAFT_89541 [Melanomma pulvis-pyrius CBS 109.77]